MAMVCARFTDAEIRMLDTLCMETKKSRSDIVRQLVAKASVPLLKSDDWTLKFYHLFGVKLTQIKYALRLPADEMWAYLCQKCSTISVKRVDTVYLVTLLRDSMQIVAKVPVVLSNNDKLSTCAEQIEEGIISELYETD